MKTQLEESIGLASRVTTFAEDGLRDLDRAIEKWPAEFRSVIWTAVAEIAKRRATAANIER